jgi:tRNA (Thr-GGU) A37 N-methylase
MAMLQRPNAVGLTLCRLVLVEEHTRNVTLASAFHRLWFDAFPATPEPF